ncbi:MAG: hypothetical protein ACTHN6_07185 [Parafilimonas sp.]
MLRINGNDMQHFAFRISIHTYIFIMTAIVTITIALATVSFQSIKATITNPVKSLRAE